MASQSGGGAAGRRRTADQAMAARLKADEVKRVHARCPVCNNLISLPHLYNHIAFHK